MQKFPIRKLIMTLQFPASVLSNSLCLVVTNLGLVGDNQGKFCYLSSIYFVSGSSPNPAPVPPRGDWLALSWKSPARPEDPNSASPPREGVGRPALYSVPKISFSPINLTKLYHTLKWSSQAIFFFENISLH